MKMCEFCKEEITGLPYLDIVKKLYYHVSCWMRMKWVIDNKERLRKLIDA